MKLKEHLQISHRSVKLLYALSHRHLICLVLSSVVTAILPFVPVYFSARLIDALTVGSDIRTLALYASLTVGITALGSLVKAWLEAQKEIGFKEVNGALDWLHAEKAMSLAYSSIEDREIALLRERIKTETQTGYNLFFLIGCVESVIQYAVQILASISLTVSFFTLAAIPRWAKLALVGGVGLNVVLTVLVKRKSASLQTAYLSDAVPLNTQLEKFMQYLDHYTSGKDIRLYAMEQPLADFVGKDVYGNVCDCEETMRFQCAGLNFIFTMMNYVLRFGVYLLLIFVALGGGLSVGAIAQYVSCIMLLLAAISGMVGAVQTSLINHEYTKRFFAYFDIKNPMYRGSLSVEKRDDNEYYIEFRDVSFKYPNTDVYALRHVNLKFKIGEKLAVVGMNGSGKTTFIKLLCRLYDPTEGVILLNGVDIRKYNYDEYMSIFSVVFQDFRLFAFSLGQNVAAGAGYSRTQAASCLKEAGFGERLSKMPKGLETSLYQDFDKQGVEISGGEAQKIALARALYKNAPFIVLDEPTAALDPVSEYEVYRKFNEISGGKTAIYISHRLASCRFCDEILVFNEGVIVQHGTHEALLAESGGKYAELWNAQAQYYTE
jgi:ATP-binding cassette, subfamily B, bacterial